MERFVPKQAYLSCAIVDIISGWSAMLFLNLALMDLLVIFVVHFFCMEVGGGGEYGIFYLG